MNPFIIAEAGVNHNGHLDLAFRLVEEAARCGVHAVKFQTFKAEKLAHRDTPKVAYQTRDASDEEESHFQMLKKLELSDEDTVKVKACCDEKGIEFMSTPYDPESVEFLKRIGCRRLKVASADLVDTWIQAAVRASGLEVIQSVGMATLDEIERWNQSYLASHPHHPRVLLQCTSNYPADPFNSNLKVMVALGERFGLPVGFSDHTDDDRSAVLSVALGATVIEKHFTLDRTMKGPDHRASLDPAGLEAYVQAIESAGKILGSEEKVVADEEKGMRRVSRKGIYAARDLQPGESLSREDVFARRPCEHLNLQNFEALCSRPLLRAIPQGQALREEDFKAPGLE